MLPDWNVAGVVPPILPSVGGADDRRSPYQISTLQLVERFNFSNERRDILRGLLEFRAALAGIGITNGIQWIDGSFLEDIENLDNRAPRDVDVVTFFQAPAGMTQADLVGANPNLFDHDHVKNAFRVDSYFWPLGGALDARQLRAVTYWYSMWSHRRDGMWKGFAQLMLTDPSEADALEALNPPQEGGEQ